MKDVFYNFTREQLVAEYVESYVGESAFSCDGKSFNHEHIPNDMPKSETYWKAKIVWSHDLHLEIARRYHLDYRDIRWLDGVIINFDDLMHMSGGKLKPIIVKCISKLEEQEASRKEAAK